MTTPFTSETTGPRSPGEALVAELRWVHDAIRHDLAVVRQLSQDVRDGSPSDEITIAIGRLQTSGPLWQLRVNCLHYCRFVHTHHRLEDVALFPELRRSNPALGPVVDKLEADHRVVSDYLDEIEAAVRELGRVDSQAGRERIAAALDGLAEHLLAHLAFEEIEISPTLLQWEEWPRF
jgi:hypothetical protein